MNMNMNMNMDMNNRQFSVTTHQFATEIPDYVCVLPVTSSSLATDAAAGRPNLSQPDAT